MPFSKKRVKGQKKKAAVSLFSWVVCCKYNRLTVLWKWNVCFFPRPVWLFCYAPKRCSPCSEQIQCTFHHNPSYQHYNHTKKKKKPQISHQKVLIPPSAELESVSRASILSCTVTLRVVLLKYFCFFAIKVLIAWWCHSGVLSLALCLYQRTVASNCRVQSQQTIVIMWHLDLISLVLNRFVAHYHSVLDWWMDLTLAMTSHIV